MSDRFPKGKPAAQRWPERTLEERFMEKVDTSGECWIWTGFVDRAGYGRFSTSSEKTAQMAYRVAYELFVGPVPSGRSLDHTCHTDDLSCPGGSICLHRRCVNPEHLEPVTLAENKARGRSLPAINARKTHCRYGHEFTPENTHFPPSGGRQCRSCNKLEKRQLKALAIDAELERFCEAPGCANRIARGSRLDKRTCSPACRTRFGRSQLCAV